MEKLKQGRRRASVRATRRIRTQGSGHQVPGKGPPPLRTSVFSPTTLLGACSLVSSHGPGARPGSRVQGKDGSKTLKSEAQFGVCAFSGQVLVSVNTYKPALRVPRTQSPLGFPALILQGALVQRESQSTSLMISGNLVLFRII